MEGVVTVGIAHGVIVVMRCCDPSMFGSVSDAQHRVRIIDESLMWDDREADVSNVMQ